MFEDEIPVGRAVDLKGAKFGKLTVLYRVVNKTGNKQARWKCQCECGNVTIVYGKSLTKGSTQSCGCFRRERASSIGKQNIKDLTGMRFGKLVAKYPTNKRSSSSVIWYCECDCGGTLEALSGNLIQGKTTSCGCLCSKGEEKIRSLLKKYSISFQTQKIFKSCFLHNYLRFDFFIQNKYLIEFDGIQHYTGWCKNLDNLKKLQERDLYKNQWCHENNIPLIRIPYWKLDTLCIEDLMLETTKFRVV